MPEPVEKVSDNLSPPSPLAAPAQPTAGSPAPVLHYAAHEPVGGIKTVILTRCGSVGEAETYANALAAAGIRSQVVDQQTELIGVYTGGASVKVLVLAEDADRASAVLKQAISDDLEPVEEPSDPQPTDESGNAIELVEAVAFDSPRLLREAATLLATAHIDAYLPTLVPRGDRPKGEGKRFRLRVAEADLQEAQNILAQSDEPDNSIDDDPGGNIDARCPKCRSWRSYHITPGLLSTLSALFSGTKPFRGYECLSCKYRGPDEAFEPA